MSLKQYTVCWLLALAASSCADPSEAPRVELPVVVDSSGARSVTTDLGYDVELTAARIAVADLAFSVAGEEHTARLWRRAVDAVIPTAHAHPGHHQGGEVTGELPGEFVVDWVADNGRQLGTAELITGSYTAADFTFARATEQLVDTDDPLLGRTALLTGIADRGGDQIEFTVIIDSPDGRQLVGAPFEADLDQGARGRLLMRFQTRDPVDGNTLFDGVEFTELVSDDDGHVVISPESTDNDAAYNRLRRAFQRHDFYSFHHED